MSDAVSKAILGGEVRGRRGLNNPAWRTVLMVGAVVVSSLLLAPLLGQIAAAVIGVVAASAIYILSLSNGSSRSVFANWTNRRRWSYAEKQGFHRFRPVSQRPVNCVPGSKDWNAYRAYPNGLESWELLGEQPQAPAVAYHWTPDGRRYLTVTVRVDGPLVGLVGDDEVERAQDAFGDLLDGWGSAEKLGSGLQITTRMLPTDMVMHESWVGDQLDPETPAEQFDDYRRLLKLIGGGRFVQRHYLTVVWDRSVRFDRAAEARGRGADGWRRLVLDELPAVLQRIEDAGFRHIAALTGPQQVALMRHLQNPDHHPDSTADVTVAAAHLPWDEDWDRVVTDGRWQHRTAVLPADAVETSERDVRWTRPLLLGMDRKLHRTLAVCVRFVPAADAKSAARIEATNDRASQIQDVKEGRLENDDTQESLSAVKRRLADMRSGQGHHGALWTAFLTISEPVDQPLVSSSAAADAAADDAGINRLDWCDSWQGAAQSLTWPMGRGVVGAAASRSSRLLESLSVRSSR